MMRSKVRDSGMPLEDPDLPDLTEPSLLVMLLPLSLSETMLASLMDSLGMCFGLV